MVTRFIKWFMIATLAIAFTGCWGDGSGDGTKPIARAGADQNATLGDSVTLSGSASSDSDGTLITYAWALDTNSTYSGSEVNITVAGLALGEHNFTLIVIDDDGFTDTDSVIVTVLAGPLLSTLKKTGQTTSHDQNQKDDGAYRVGVDHKYTTVTIDTNITTTDNVTGLVWQDSGLATGKSWADANTTCAELVFAGSTEWRLPTVKELLYIIDSSTTTNPNGFSQTASGGFWSSATSADNAGFAWYVDFGGGYAYRDRKSHDYSVRCVRGGQ